jgi:hypothetical protein
MSAEWELSKENVQPVKRGRSANVLGERLVGLKSKGSDTIEEKQKLVFESMIVKAKENEAALDVEENPAHASDINDKPNEENQSLLEVYLLYFKWVRDTFPSSSDKALEVLEAATRDLKEHEGIKNDPRYIKLWVEYVSEMN